MKGESSGTAGATGARLVEAMRTKLEAARLNAIYLTTSSLRTNLIRHIDGLVEDLGRLAPLLGGTGPVVPRDAADGGAMLAGFPYRGKAAADDGMEDCACVDRRPGDGGDPLYGHVGRVLIGAAAHDNTFRTAAKGCCDCGGSGRAAKGKPRAEPAPDDGKEDCTCVELGYGGVPAGRTLLLSNLYVNGRRLTAAKGCVDCHGSGKRHVMGAHKPQFATT